MNGILKRQHWALPQTAHLPGALAKPSQLERATPFSMVPGSVMNRPAARSGGLSSRRSHKREAKDSTTGERRDEDDSAYHDGGGIAIRVRD